MIAYTFTSDDDTTDLLDNLDGYFLYIYIVEIVVKLLGLGFIEYFSDGWNILDFVLTLITIVTQIAVSVTRFAKTARASKFVKSLRV